MRDIKFRAWDNINKIMAYPRIIKQIFSSISSGDLLNRYEILMQYTGLKDKNGKEIYEGDIITFGKYIKYRVIFEDSCFYLYHHEGLKDWDGTDYRWGPLYRIKELSFDVELIGNIYENPELL